MTTKTIDLACGRKMVLKMVSLHKIAATDIDIPNQAKVDLSDLAVYGAMISGRGDDKKRSEENWRLIRSQFQLAKLLCHAPKLWLSAEGGECPPDAIADDDLFPADLVKIQDFFFNGGSDGVPAAEDNQRGEGTRDDRAGAAVGEDAGGTAGA